ncbi:MAG: DUF547 domain-containing protein [Planctomycetes bacterium]|nr:DUF547 domain-containing protein [Planctomycetota bacterium]
MIRRPFIRVGLMLFVVAGCTRYQEPADAAPTNAAPPPAAASPESSTPPPPRPSASRPDPVTTSAEYGRLLEEIVTPKGLVRYDQLRQPDLLARLDAIVRGFAGVPLPADRAERLALWCNAYNANVLAFAVRDSAKPGFTGVNAVDGFFKKRPITVARQDLTLDRLENERVRPLGDPRTHAALVCAAMSCPPLRAEPYDAKRLDAQLDDQSRRWVNDPTRFSVKRGVLGLSKIMEWYGKDFEVPPYTNAAGFVAAHAESGGPIARYVIDTPAIRTRWIDYDWSLNQAR